MLIRSLVQLVQYVFLSATLLAILVQYGFLILGCIYILYRLMRSVDEFSDILNLARADDEECKFGDM